MKIMTKMIVVVFLIAGFSGIIFAETKNPQPAMTVKFENSKKIIAHPSGVISEYNQADLEKQRAMLIEQRNILNEQITEVDKELVEVKKTGE
jgi:hypothetical protein